MPTTVLGFPEAWATCPQHEYHEKTWLVTIELRALSWETLLQADRDTRALYARMGLPEPHISAIEVYQPVVLLTYAALFQ